MPQKNFACLRFTCRSCFRILRQKWCKHLKSTHNFSPKIYLKLNVQGCNGIKTSRLPRKQVRVCCFSVHHLFFSLIFWLEETWCQKTFVHSLNTSQTQSLSPSSQFICTFTLINEKDGWHARVDGSCPSNSALLQLKLRNWWYCYMPSKYKSFCRF